MFQKHLHNRQQGDLSGFAAFSHDGEGIALNVFGFQGQGL